MNWLKYSFILLLFSCSAQDEKINGVSFVASREAVNASHVKPVLEIGANHAAVMPFGFLRTINSPEVVYNVDRQWFGETKAGAKQYIETLKKANIKVMLKPQIWVWRGEYTGDIVMQSEADWEALEASYSTFILDYAQLAEQTNVPLFCIGTELDLFVKHRPDYWVRLIKDIKTIYSGKLTYAANWDEFKRTPFWADLDYIGIDAYFPVSDKKTPTVEDCIAGWNTHLPIIKETAAAYQKPILFTEYGYRSVDYTGKEPWVSSRSMKQVNLEAQVNATQALFETFWNENWFAGGFIWKWFHNHTEAGGHSNSRFTPQNKPAEAVIKTYYQN